MNKIRKFIKDDIDDVIQIWYSSSVDTYKFVDEMHWEKIKKEVRDRFLNSNIYVYDEDNIVKAFILINGQYIDELYVLKEYRLNGLGKKLLDFVKSNNNELLLNVFQKNTNAIEFYKKNEFKIIEENVEDYTREKGYLMKWKR